MAIGVEQALRVQIPAHREQAVGVRLGQADVGEGGLGVTGLEQEEHAWGFRQVASGPGPWVRNGLRAVISAM